MKVTVKLKTTKKKKNNTKKLVCKVTVKPKATTPDNPNTPDDPTPPSTTGVSISEVIAESESKLTVKFSGTVNRTTLENKENYKIAGVEVTEAVATDDMTVVLTLSGAEADKEYTLNVTGLKDAQDKDISDLSKAFKTPASVAAGYKLEFETSSKELRADGTSELPINCKVTKDGKVVDGENYTIKFETDRGKFSSADVVTVNGVAENILHSQALDEDQTAHITATIIRVEGNNDESIRGRKAELEIRMVTTLSNIEVDNVVGAGSGVADRLTLYFQNEVNPDKYTKEDGSIDKSKIKIDVYDDISLQEFNSKKLTSAVDYSTESTEDGKRVVNFKKLANNSHAFQVLVDQPLANNRYIGVYVEITDEKTGKKVPFTEVFTLQDSETPRLLKVEPVDRRHLKVTYSEAVLSERVIASGRTTNADNTNNNSINGVLLSDSQWGSRTLADIDVGTGEVNADDRNVVTITLGDSVDRNGKISYARFNPGIDYLLTVRNVGDWASNTSGVNNIIQSDGKPFTVIGNDDKPDIKEVIVESPEQFLVRFNHDVAVVTDGDSIQALNTDNDADTLYPSLLQLWDGNTNIGNETNGANRIRVTKISNSEYRVETTKDWTRAYSKNGDVDVFDSYYHNHNYRFVVEANKLINVENGEVNTSSITYNITDEKMKSFDGTAPKIKGAVGWDNDKQECTVEFTEPVKVYEPDNTTKQYLNLEGATPSVTQIENQGGIPKANIRFINTRLDQSIKGYVDRIVDSADTKIVAKPADDLYLSPDDNWVIQINGITDDYGNAVSDNSTFKVPVGVSQFRVAWATVSSTSTYTPGTSSQGWNAGSGNFEATDDIARYIFVKFTDAVPANSNLLLNTTYSINNNTIPSDAHITFGIKGYDDKVGRTDSVTIEIPARSAYILKDAANGQRVTLSINTDRVTSSTGLNLDSGSALLALPYKHDFTSGASDNAVTANNAIFGDNDKEQSSAYSTPDAYKTAVLNALKDGDYRRVELSDDINLSNDTLKITRPVDIDLKGHNITGTNKAKIYVTYKDGATCTIKSSGDSGRIFAPMTIDTPYADWKIGINSDSSSMVTCDRINVHGIASNTLTNYGTITELELNTNSADATIKNTKAGVISSLFINRVNKDAQIKVDTTGTTSTGIGDVAIKSPLTVVLTGETGKIGNVFVENKAKGITLGMKNGVVGTIELRTSGVVVKAVGEDGKMETSSASKLTTAKSNVNGIVEVLKDRLVSSLKVGATSGGALQVSDIVKDANTLIDSANGSTMPEGYQIVAIVGDQFNKMNQDSKLFNMTKPLGTVESGSTIEIYVVPADTTKENITDAIKKAGTVKNIKVE